MRLEKGKRSQQGATKGKKERKKELIYTAKTEPSTTEVKEKTDGEGKSKVQIRVAT